MSLLTGPQRLIKLLQDDWQPTRVGRGDIPDVVRDSGGDPSSDPTDGDGVLVVRDREEVRFQTSRHDLIHCYHPEGNTPEVNDRGYDEQRIVETVQVDISITDRTDHTTDPSDRLLARERMVGDRDDVADTSEPPYPGISGEVQFILEGVRRGLDEWDRVDYTPVRATLGNSNADVSWNVDLIRLAANTV